MDDGSQGIVLPVRDNDDSACDQAGVGNGCYDALNFLTWDSVARPTPCPTSVLTSYNVEAFRASVVRVAYPAAGTYLLILEGQSASA
jgi:hypothetical protein